MSLDLQIEQGEVRTETTYIVTAKLKFTDVDLNDSRPIQITKKQLFDLVAKKQDAATENVVQMD